jgi:hypothetical protein
MRAFLRVIGLPVAIKHCEGLRFIHAWNVCGAANEWLTWGRPAIEVAVSRQVIPSRRLPFPRFLGQRGSFATYSRQD